jgi:hypothetical protein
MPGSGVSRMPSLRATFLPSYFAGRSLPVAEIRGFPRAWVR